MEGPEPAAVVEDWVVEVEEGVGSREERFGAIAAGMLEFSNRECDTDANAELESGLPGRRDMLGRA